MDIVIEPHTLERSKQRGATEEEIRDVLETGISVRAKYGRLARYKVYPFNKERMGKYYEQKKVEVIYIIEEARIFTITVYVFYGKREE